MAHEDSAAAWMRRLVDAAQARPASLSWLLALAVFGASLFLRVWLARWLAPMPFLAFFPAIAATALFCGWRQGAAVLLLADAAAWLLHTREPHLDLARGVTVVGLLGFLAAGGFILALTTSLAETIRRLEAATRVQDGLFRELQHRVANNMQTVAGMLALARRELRDPAALAVLAEAGERIASMATLHRKLSDRRAYDAGLAPILREVLAEAFRDLAVEPRLDIREERLSFDQMTAIVLLVNEAALNAAKHVFGPARGTVFEVALAPLPSGRLRLTVRDDGPGVAPGGRVATPPAAAEPMCNRAADRPNPPLGMTIMRAFASQLGGSLDLASGPGTTWRVEFAPA